MMNLFENLQIIKESDLLDYDDWFNINYRDLINDYIEKYEINNEDDFNYEEFDESEINDDEFREFAEDRYEYYVRQTNNYFDYDDEEDEEDDEDEYFNETFTVSVPKQKYTSAKTSINSSKLPAIFKMVSFKPDTINLDYGGGRFDNVADELIKNNVTNLVYDPYNRSSEHNSQVINILRKNSGADSATCSNVLNVIAEPEAREIVLKNIYKLIKSGAPVYFTVYEGNKSGEGSETKSGYQLNKKTNDYLEEIKQVFPNAKRKGKLIFATK